MNTAAMGNVCLAEHARRLRSSQQAIETILAANQFKQVRGKA